MTIHKPSIRPTFKSNDNEIKTTIDKALQIQNILLYDKMVDKKLEKQHTNYMIEYIQILNLLDDKCYSDTLIQNKINNLYDKIFKNRRY